MTETMMAPVQVDDEESGSKKPLLIAAGVGGAVLLAGAGWFFLKGGSSDEALPPVVQHVVKTKPAAAKPTAAKPLASTPKGTTKLPTASTVKIGRDPFAALYVVPVTTGAAGGTTSTTGTTGTTGTTPSTGTTTPTTPSSTDTSANTRYTLVLTRITQDPGGAPLYSFSLAGKSKTVLTAQRFGSYGELVVLAPVKDKKGRLVGVILQVGDDNPVEVLVGAKTSVQ